MGTCDWTCFTNVFCRLGLYASAQSSRYAAIPLLVSAQHDWSRGPPTNMRRSTAGSRDENEGGTEATWIRVWHGQPSMAKGAKLPDSASCRCRPWLQRYGVEVANSMEEGFAEGTARLHQHYPIERRMPMHFATTVLQCPKWFHTSHSVPHRPSTVFSARWAPCLY